MFQEMLGPGKTAARLPLLFVLRADALFVLHCIVALHFWTQGALFQDSMKLNQNEIKQKVETSNNKNCSSAVTPFCPACAQLAVAFSSVVLHSKTKCHQNAQHKNKIETHKNHQPLLFVLPLPCTFCAGLLCGAAFLRMAMCIFIKI